MASLASRFALPAKLPLISLPCCTNPACLRPPTLWQRWWARHEGIACERDWYCSPECFAAGLRPRVEQLTLTSGKSAVRQRFPLGLVLLEQGIISQEQLRRALRRQRQAGAGRIGEWLVQDGAATKSDIVEALSIQQNCPIFSRSEPPSFSEVVRFPGVLLEHYGAVPVYFSIPGNTLYLGFAGTVNRPLLRACAHVMRCRVEPCIVEQGLHRLATEAWNNASRASALCVEQRQSPAEITRSIAGYAEQAKASSCLVARCEDYVWARLYGDIASFDLLFRVGLEDSGPNESASWDLF